MSRSRHVVIVGPAPPYRGGISQHTALLSEAMEHAGHEVAIESWGRQYPSLLYRRVEREEGVSSPPNARFSLRWYDPISWWRAARRTRSADHLVLQWVTPFHVVPYLVLRWVMAPGATTVIVHNAVPHETFPLLKILTRLGMRSVDQVVCHADAVVTDLDKLGVRVPDTRVVAMPPLARTTATALPDRPPIRLLFLGYLRHYKGVDIAIEAMTRLPADLARSVRLTVAGESWDSDRPAAEIVTEFELEGSVEVIDRYLSDDEMTSLIADHHLLVAPYRTATQSGVVALALASGRPVIATDVGGLSELVEPGFNGVLCSPDDPAAFSQAIVEGITKLDLLADGALRSQASWSDVAGAILEV